MPDLDEQIRERIAQRPKTFPGLTEDSPTRKRQVEWVESAAAALLAVLALHQPARGSSGAAVWQDCAHCRDTNWGGPDVPWPCETVEAIAKELGIEVADA